MYGKKLLILSAIIIVIPTILITGLAATLNNSQTWYLNSTTHDTEPPEVMQKVDISTDKVRVGAGQSNIWVADEIALGNVTFCGNWIIEIERCTHSDNWTEDCTALVGTWEAGIDGGFTPFDTTGFIRSNPSEFIIKIEFETGCNTVPQGHYLSLEVTNNDGPWLDHDIYTDGDSILISPSNNPGYPMSEIATGVLLFAGLIGLGTFIGIRRRKTVS
jgi:hypothetical protein